MLSLLALHIISACEDRDEHVDASHVLDADGVACAGEPAGLSGGSLDTTLTVCVRDSAGAPVASATIQGGTQTTVTVGSGRAVIVAHGSADFEVAPLEYSFRRAFFGVRSERFTVVLPPRPGWFYLNGTVSGLASVVPAQVATP